MIDHLWNDPVLLGLLYAYVVMIGACEGSFASAVSYRVARGQSWIFADQKKSGHKSRQKSGAARSACPVCGHPLAWFDLIPVVSWCVSIGRCRYCRSPISARYPVIELIGAFALAGYTYMAQDILLMVLCALTLPFALTAALLWIENAPVPRYILALSGGNLAVWGVAGLRYFGQLFGQS